MKIPGLAGWLAVATVCLAAGVRAAGPAERMTILAGPAQGVEAQLARELAGVAGPRSATGRAAAVVTAGTVDTLLRLRDGAGVRLGIVPADAAAAYKAAAERGFGEAANRVAPLRAIVPLHRSSFHFIVRADSDYAAFEDLRGARINFGPVDGNTAVSALNLYRTVFGAAIADEQASFLSHEDALARLVTDRTIDVAVIIAVQPAKILADMTPDARRYVKLLGVRGDGAAHAAAPAYSADRLLAGHYPNLIDRDVDSLAVRSLLVFHEARPGAGAEAVAAFVKAFCGGLARLRSEGDPAWREVDLGLPDAAWGWFPAPAVVRNEVGRCAGTPENAAPPACAAAERALRVCD